MSSEASAPAVWPPGTKVYFLSSYVSPVPNSITTLLLEQRTISSQPPIDIDITMATDQTNHAASTAKEAGGSASDILSIRSEIMMFAPDFQSPPEGLYRYLLPVEGQRQSTFDLAQPYEVDIRDLRIYASHEDRIKAGFTLETAAFEIFDGFGDDKTRTALRRGKHQDMKWITEEYCRDVTKLLEKRLAVEGFEVSVAILGHRIRLPTSADQRPSQGGANRSCHVDQSDAEGMKLVAEIFGQEAAERLRLAGDGKGDGAKAMVINCWRLLRDNPANSWPLAMIDARTLDASDLLTGYLYNNGPESPGYGQFIITDRPLSLYSVRHRDGPQRTGRHGTQDWWYLGSQTVDEAILLRIWASIAGKLSIFSRDSGC